MVKYHFERKVAKGNPVAKRKSKTVPDQSMSIKEIIRRFTRGIPADVIQRPQVFVDQSEFDLERLSRLDATDKAYYAEQMRADNERIAGDLERARNEAVERMQERQKEAEKQARDASENTGKVDLLDNTLPVDTILTNRKLGGKK